MSENVEKNENNDSEHFINMMSICTDTLKTDTNLPKLHCEVIFKIMNTIIGVLENKSIGEQVEPCITMKIFDELDILKPTSFLHNDNNPVFFICKSCVRL